MINLKSDWSDQISRSVVSDSLRPHESQHARPPCPSPIPGVHWDSRPSSQWCHPAISSSVVRFSSCPQSLPASESFPMSQPFSWGGQSTGVSALASFLPKNTQDWSPSEWTGWISLQSKGLSRGEADNRGWDGWMASLTRWIWVWVNSGSCDGQGGLVCCDSRGRKESDITERLIWSDLIWQTKVRKINLQQHRISGEL